MHFLFRSRRQNKLFFNFSTFVKFRFPTPQKVLYHFILTTGPSNKIIRIEIKYWFELITTTIKHRSSSTRLNRMFCLISIGGEELNRHLGSQFLLMARCRVWPTEFFKNWCQFFWTKSRFPKKNSFIWSLNLNDNGKTILFYEKGYYKIVNCF